MAWFRWDGDLMILKKDCRERLGGAFLRNDDVLVAEEILAWNPTAITCDLHV